MVNAFCNVYVIHRANKWSLRGKCYAGKHSSKRTVVIEVPDVSQRTLSSTCGHTWSIHEEEWGKSKNRLKRRKVLSGQRKLTERRALPSRKQRRRQYQEGRCVSRLAQCRAVSWTTVTWHPPPLQIAHKNVAGGVAITDELVLCTSTVLRISTVELVFSKTPWFVLAFFVLNHAYASLTVYSLYSFHFS